MTPPAEERDRRRAVARALGEMWRAAASAPLCPPGCLCVGGGLFFVGAKEIEGDVIAFLQQRFAADAPETARLVEARAASGRGSFDDWLDGLSEAELDPAEFDALTGALETLLESLTAPASPAPLRLVSN